MTRIQGSRFPTARQLGIAIAIAGTALLASADEPSATDRGAQEGHRHGGPGAFRGRDVDLAMVEQHSKDAFERIDSNDDDKISPAEIAAAGPMRGGMHMGRAMRHRMHGGMHGRPPGPPMGNGPEGEGPPEAERAEMLGALFARLDVNRDGRLSNDEFKNLRDAQKAEMQARHFARMDSNGDGSLSRTEFPPMLARLRTLDANHDGKVTRDEFPRGMHGPHGARPEGAAERPTDAPPSR